MAFEYDLKITKKREGREEGERREGKMGREGKGRGRNYFKHKY